MLQQKYLAHVVFLLTIHRPGYLGEDGVPTTPRELSTGDPPNPSDMPAIFPTAYRKLLEVTFTSQPHGRSNYHMTKSTHDHNYILRAKPLFC